MKDVNAYQETIEKLKEEKQLTEKLLGISEALVNVSQREQLFHIIVEKIGKLLPMDDLAIVIVNEDKTQWKDISISRGLNQKKITQELTEGGFDVWLDMNSLIERFLSSTEIMTIEDYKKFKDFPSKFTQIMEEDGLKEFIHTPLRMADKVFGALVFDARKSGTYDESHFSLFQAIADQLAVAVSNVLAQEELLKRQKRIEDLLKISTAASNIQSRSELLKVIFETIKPVFPFDNAGLFIIDQKNDEHYEILDNIDILGQHDATQVALIKANLLGRFKHRGSTIDYLSRPHGPYLFDIREDSKKWPHPQVKLALEYGIRQLIGIGLRSGNETFGMLCFNSKKKNFYSEKNFSLFKAISEQVAVAVSNVLAQEESLIHQKRIEDLLKISTAASNIQSRSELLKVIFETIKPIFPFDSAGLFIIDHQNDEHYEILDDIDILGKHDASQVEAIKANLLGRFQHSGSAIDYLSQSRGPYIFDLKKDKKKWPHPQVNVMLKNRLRQVIGIGLKSGSETFGMLCFNSKKEDFYSEKDFPFFKAISEQVALAVSNVLAQEESLIHQKRIEDLLKISTAASNIQSRRELLKVIFETIKPVFPFDTAGLFIIDHKNDEHYEILDNIEILGQHDATQVEIINSNLLGRFKHKGSGIEYVSRKGGPHLFDLKKDAKKWPHPQISTMLENGLRQLIGIGLKSGNETFGMLCFSSKKENFYSDQDFSFFNAISEQVALAVSNVLSSEEVLLQKEKVENLLSISNTISTIASGADLIRLILTDLKRFFPFDDAGLFVYDFAAKKERDLVVDYNFNMGFSKTLYDEGLSGWMPISDASLFTTNKGPHVLTPDELLNKYPHPHFEYLKKHGFKIMIGGPLKNGGEVIGMLCFWSFNENAYSDDSIATFKSISDQVGIALGNVLANEQLLEEKKKTEDLLAVTESIANITTGPELVKAIFDKLQKIFPFDDAGLFQMDNDKKMERDLIVDFGYDTSSEINEELRKKGLVGWMPLSQGVNHLSKSGIVTLGTEVYELFDHPHFENQENRIFRQIISGPLRQGENTIGALCFWSKKENAFQGQESLFKSIIDQISVALSNIIANEQLISEKKKTEDLLAVTESIANITTGPELIRAIFGKLHNVFPFDEIGLFHLDFENNRERDLTVYNQYDLDKENTTHTTNGLMEWMPIRQCTTYLSESLIINGQEIYEQLHHPPFEDPENRIFKQIIAGPLKEGDKTIGMLCFWSKEENEFDGQESLFKSITDQMSVALSNIIANEDIQQREMEKSLQVDIFNALNDSKLWEQKLSGVTQVLQRHIPFNLIVFNFFETEEATGERLPFYSLERLGIEEYRLFDLAHFSKMTGMGENSLKQAFAATDLEPNIFDYDNLGKKVRKNEFLSVINKVFGTNSILNYPTHLDKERTIYISLFSKEASAFKEKHLSLLRSAEQSLLLSLERQLAYDEIQLLNERLQSEKKYLQSEMQATYHFGEIIGESAIMQMVFKQINDVASLDTTVLIQGETGTGKELVARAIHENSLRQDALLVKVNCAAIPRETVESELFGHVKGAFTGAIKDRIGKFELADGGTIFLDEIGELSLDLQAKLLRVLQEKEVEQLGSNRLKKIDFRVIAATNRNLSLEVEKGNFRSDLFYRLHIFPMQLPPLRLRENDVILIAEQIAEQVCIKIGTTFKGFSNASKKVLLSYAWPGNVRELQNLIEQTLIQNRGEIENLRPGFQPVSVDTPLKADSFEDIVNADNLKEITLEDIDLRTQELEKAYLYAILNHTKWRVSGRDGAAALLDVKATTLEYRLKKLGISRKSS